MEYIVSARKYRPLSFDSVVGQTALTTTLKNAVKSGKLAHAYLFCGPRGVGKTTCARIFAKAINCENVYFSGVRPYVGVGPILSVFLQAWYTVEYLFTVDENVFNPPPKVKSGVIRLTRNGVTDLGCDEKLFRTVVKTAFGQRRKMLRSSLKGLFGPGGIPEGAVPMMTLRPEQLSVEQFVSLTNHVAESRRPSSNTTSL